MTDTTIRLLSAMLAAFTLSIATPALAQQPATSENLQSQRVDPHAGIWRYGNARAQAVPDGMMSRGQAIRDCTAAEQKFTQPTWGEMEYYAYRACMAQHGQVE